LLAVLWRYPLRAPQLQSPVEVTLAGVFIPRMRTSRPPQLSSILTIGGRPHRRS